MSMLRERQYWAIAMGYFLLAAGVAAQKTPPSSTAPVEIARIASRNQSRNLEAFSELRSNWSDGRSKACQR
jgi:hypothetical protein